jgi:hypothetical protein
MRFLTILHSMINDSLSLTLYNITKCKAEIGSLKLSALFLLLELFVISQMKAKVNEHFIQYSM